MGNERHYPRGTSRGGQFAPKYDAFVLKLYEESVKDPLLLSSTKSYKKSLEAIRSGKANLDKRRQSILSRVPKSNDWSNVQRNSVNIKDLAYLTAATGHEFALLRGKKEDYLFHGKARSCTFTDLLEDMLRSGKVCLIAHSHPGEEVPIPSTEDRELLKTIGQQTSIIVSGLTGIHIEFTQEG